MINMQLASHNIIWGKTFNSLLLYIDNPQYFRYFKNHTRRIDIMGQTVQRYGFDPESIMVLYEKHAAAN